MSGRSKHCPKPRTRFYWLHQAFQAIFTARFDKTSMTLLPTMLSSWVEANRWWYLKAAGKVYYYWNHRTESKHQRWLGGNRLGVFVKLKVLITWTTEIAKKSAWYKMWIIQIHNPLPQAMKTPETAKWQQDINEELKSLCDNRTWGAVSKPANTRPLHIKWVFETKTDGAGKIERYKVRLVACGNEQEQGVNYSNTFAPVMDMATARFILALCVITTAWWYPKCLNWIWQRPEFVPPAT